ncbi:hypothetical protein M758_7G133400, partial [Ceratodon purpureus]
MTNTSPELNQPFTNRPKTHSHSRSPHDLTETSSSDQRGTEIKRMQTSTRTEELHSHTKPVSPPPMPSHSLHILALQPPRPPPHHHAIHDPRTLHSHNPKLPRFPNPTKRNPTLPSNPPKRTSPPLLTLATHSLSRKCTRTAT